MQLSQVRSYHRLSKPRQQWIIRYGWWIRHSSKKNSFFSSRIRLPKRCIRRLSTTGIDSSSIEANFIHTSICTGQKFDLNYIKKRIKNSVSCLPEIRNMDTNNTRQVHIGRLFPHKRVFGMNQVNVRCRVAGCSYMHIFLCWHSISSFIVSRLSIHLFLCSSNILCLNLQ